LRENLNSWWTAILIGLVLAVEIALNFFGFNLYFAAWVAVVLLIIRIIILEHELSVRNSVQPSIIQDGFKLEPPFPIWRGNVATEDVLERYYIMFRNVKARGKKIIDTEPVHATVSYYHQNRRQLKSVSHEKPFWLGSVPPWERPLNHDVIIKASSEPEGVCIILKKSGTNELYAFSDNSYASGRRSLEPFQETLRIRLRKFYVRVELRAANIDMKPIWVLITNHGKRSKPSFELLSTPIIPYESKKVI
jgi:hypothetical protein